MNPYIKAAAVPRSVAIPAIGALTAGGLAVSDALKARGLGQARVAAGEYLKGGRGGPVDVPKEIGGRKVRVISTEQQARSMKPDLPFGFISAPIARMKAKQMLGVGHGAYVLKGKGEDYIIAGKRVPKEVMQHEIVHLRKGHHLKSPGLLSLVHKPTFRKRVVQHEQEVWRAIPDFPFKHRMQEISEETYRKGFHETRAGLLAALSGVFGYSAARKLLSKGRQ